jgi:hypothetical protein
MNGEDKKERENMPIRIYWWNMGDKTLDHKGTIKSYLLKRDIKVIQIKNTKNPYSTTIKGYRFKINISPLYYVIFDGFNRSYDYLAIDAIKIWLMLMGDKAKIETENRSYNINW